MISNNMRSSYRGSLLTQSPIRSLIPHARKAKEESVKVYHLNIGQPDILTPPEALDAIKGIKDTIVKYGPSEGLPFLRNKVARYYDKFGTTLHASDIFVTTGASEAILYALFSCCDEHDEIIIPEPFYANYIGFSHTSSVHIVPVTTSFEDQFSLPEPEAFERLITNRTRAIFLCNPGNPTGQLYSRDQLERLIDLVVEKGLFLIVDEVYREFCYDKEFTSVLSFEKAAQNVVVIDSISKVFSACGARIGYLITKNRAIQETVNKYAQLRLCPPYLGQMMAAACYENADAYIHKAREEYRQRREVLYQGLLSIEGVRCYKPDAAFYNIVELPVDDCHAFCKWLLTDFRSDGSTVMIAPADGFYHHQVLGKKQARLAYVLNQHDLKICIEILRKALQAYPNRTI